MLNYSKKLHFQDGIKLHDDSYMNINFDSQWLKAINVKTIPFSSTNQTKQQETRFAQTFQTLNSKFENLYYTHDPKGDIHYR